MRALAVTALLAGWLGCATAPPPPPPAPPSVHDYYPLRAGSAWSYDVDAGDGSRVLAITKVDRVVGDAVEVRTGQGLLAYRLARDGIVRARDGTYLLKAPLSPGTSWAAAGGATATVDAAGLAIEVPAGRFEGCVRVLEQGGRAETRVETVYCPRVGPVRVISTLQLSASEARVEAVLRGFALGAAP